MPRTETETSTRRSNTLFDSIQPLDLLHLALHRWYWFVLSLAITLGCAGFYLLTTAPTYTRTLSFLLKSDERTSGAEEQLKELGLYPTSTNVSNELLTLRTVSIATEVTKRLHLGVQYTRPGAFHSELVYGAELPITATFDHLGEQEEASLHLILLADSTLVLSKVKYRDQESVETFKGRLGKPIATPAGPVTIVPNNNYRSGTTLEVDVFQHPLRTVVNQLRANTVCARRDKNSTLIDIKYTDISITRAEDILNMLMTVYNETWVTTRNKIIISTNNFIKERLEVIEQELGDVEENISAYKSENLMPDVQQAGNLALSQATATDQEAQDLNNRIYMVRYIRNYLIDTQYSAQLLPSSTGIQNAVIAQQINEYNTTLLQRNNHLANSSEQNPLVKDLNQQLGIMRTSLLQTLDNELAMLQSMQNNVHSHHAQAISKVASNPRQAKYLLSVERQQKVKESLYLFLLQKREENELNQAFTAYNTQIIEPPHGSMTPTHPVHQQVLLIALALGLGIPLIIIFLREWSNTTVRGRKDIEKIHVPFIGEIPYFKQKKSQTAASRTHPKLLIQADGRDYINEAFRVVRTNLEFALGFNADHHVVMLTSINPRSGKTFCTANLSATFGLKDKRVLAIDLDLRRHTLSHYLGNHLQGVANYLSGQIEDFRTLIRNCGPIDILPAGTLVPNPSELLSSPRFSQLMESVRTDYDFVFLDCPPLEMVADAGIINRFADITLFVCRAHLLDRRSLIDVEKWYDEKRLVNLTILLNGTTDEDERGYGYKHYGYHSYSYN